MPNLVICANIGRSRSERSLKVLAIRSVMPRLAPAAVIAFCANASTVNAEVFTLSYVITGQPNIAVRLQDVDVTSASGAAAPCQIELGTVVEKDTAPRTFSVQLVCVAGGLQVGFDGRLNGTLSTAAGAAASWSFDAASPENQARYDFRPSVEMVDVMYDTRLDSDDVMTGRFSVSVNNDFLTSKYGWVKGSSDMAEVTRKNGEVKDAAGGCPVLRSGHRRMDDLPG